MSALRLAALRRPRETSAASTSARSGPRARTARLQALVDLNLEVGQSEFIVLLGPSGCGKSTLLYLISGLETPSVGPIECDGVEVSEPSSDRSLIFQESSLYPWLSVADNVTFGLKLRGDGKAERTANRRSRSFARSA